MLAVKRKKKTHRKNFVILMPVSSVWLTTSLIPGEGTNKATGSPEEFPYDPGTHICKPPFLYLSHSSQIYFVCKV